MLGSQKALLTYKGAVLKTKSLLVSLLAMASTLHGAEIDPSLKSEIQRLTPILTNLIEAVSFSEKIAILDKVPEVEEYFSEPSLVRSFLAGLSGECELAVKATFAIGQGERIFDVPSSILDPIPHYRRLLDDLLTTDLFYKDIGGIIGYQCLVLSLLTKPEETMLGVELQAPKRIDLSDEHHRDVRHAILEGIRNQKDMAEFYPVGGAADRLQLKDGKTGKGLPAACLIFQGKNLLEGVIRDLQAREYLYYKIWQAPSVTPLALMTSKINHNHDYIQEICVQNGWFGRPRESFKFFSQPSVPVFTQEGNWCLQKPLKLLLRPGGHGVIWKLAEDKGVFDWLSSLGRSKALVRQINNPMAAVDYGLSAFLGVGHEGNKMFGFASCERLVNAHEGSNVLKITHTPEGNQVTLTNVEYCDFEKFGLEDKPREAGSPYSLFPSNTNILFADLEAVRQAVKKIPFPGLLVNFREGLHYTFEEGSKREEIARLETTMQNIADAFEVPFDGDIPDDLPSYVTFNERRKTISTTKRKTASNGKLLETPEGCFYDFMQNAQELLSDHCNMKLTTVDDERAFLQTGPPFLMSYHPALGPLYSIIQQKIQGGEILSGSELQLEIADLEMKNLFLDGSLLILARDVLGHRDEKGALVYSNQTGQCVLKNVRVENEGIDWNADEHLFWKHEVKRKASLTIQLSGHSRFEAKDVTFYGDQTIEVPEGMHMTASQNGKELLFETVPIDSQESFWSYDIGFDETIDVTR